MLLRCHEAFSTFKRCVQALWQMVPTAAAPIPLRRCQTGMRTKIIEPSIIGNAMGRARCVIAPNAQTELAKLFQFQCGSHNSSDSAPDECSYDSE